MSVRVCLCLLAAACLDLCSAAAETEKASKSTQTPKAKEGSSKMVNWDALEPVDYLRSLALIGGFLLVFLSDKRAKSDRSSGGRSNVWVNAEVVVFFVAGVIAYFFPANALSYIIKTKLNIMHEVDMQFLGALLISLAINTARTQSIIESDCTVHATWLGSRLVSASILLAMSLISHYTKDCFTEQQLTFQTLALFLWLVSCIYQLPSVGDYGSRGTTREVSSSGFNRFLLIEVTFLVPAMIAGISNPAFFYDSFCTTKNLDAGNFFINELNGILTLCSLIQPCLHIFHDSDGLKREFFYGRLVLLGLILPMLVLQQLKNGIMTSQGAVFTAAFESLLLAVYVMAYYYKGGSKAKTR